MPKRTKIVLLITKANFGGAQRYVFDLATSLSQDEFDIEVVLGGDGVFKEKLAKRNIHTTSLAELQRDISLVKEIRSFFSLLKIFRTSRPDIVHLNSSKAGGLGVFATRLISLSCFLLHLLNARRYTLYAPRIIFTAHGWPFCEKRNRLWKVLVWIASYLTALLSTDIIVISSQDFDQVRTMPFIITKTHLIRNGIKIPEFFSREEGREKLELRQDALVVGSIGELAGNKNYAGLIEVVGHLREKYDFELIVIGEGADRDKLTERIKDNPVLLHHARLVGFKEDACKYLKAFDVFVLNSDKEGLPYVLLEAGAAGLPVVATSVGGIPDIIENERTGLLVPPYQMGEALRKLLTERKTREELGSALNERIEKGFSFERMLRETIAVYKDR